VGRVRSIFGERLEPNHELCMAFLKFEETRGELPDTAAKEISAARMMPKSTPPMRSSIPSTSPLNILLKIKPAIITSPAPAMKIRKYFIPGPCVKCRAAQMPAKPLPR